MTAPHLCQLAGNWTGALPPCAIAQQKIDGWRALWLRDRAGKPALFTRNGHTIPGVEHIRHELLAWERHAGQPMFFDGEFVVDQGGDTLATTKHWCETGHKLGGNAGRFHIFDGFAYDDWYRGGTDQPWFERKAAIEALSLSVKSDEAHAWEWRPGSYGSEEGADPVRVVPHCDLVTADCAVDMAAQMWKAGLEGIVIKDALAGYQRNRTKDWLKVGRPWQERLGWKAAA